MRKPKEETCPSRCDHKIQRMFPGLKLCSSRGHVATNPPQVRFSHAQPASCPVCSSSGVPWPPPSPESILSHSTLGKSRRSQGARSGERGGRRKHCVLGAAFQGRAHGSDSHSIFITPGVDAQEGRLQSCCRKWGAGGMCVMRGRDFPRAVMAPCLAIIIFSHLNTLCLLISPYT